jgi:hypothetical protein
MKYVFFKKGKIIFIKAATLSLCAEAKPCGRPTPAVTLSHRRPDDRPPTEENSPAAPLRTTLRRQGFDPVPAF